MITSFSERNEVFTAFYSVVILIIVLYLFVCHYTDHVSISLSKPNNITSEKIRKSIYLALLTGNLVFLIVQENYK